MEYGIIPMQAELWPQVREIYRIGKLADVWRDVLLLERRSSKAGI